MSHYIIFLGTQLDPHLPAQVTGHLDYNNLIGEWVVTVLLEYIVKIEFLIEVFEWSSYTPIEHENPVFRIYTLICECFSTYFCTNKNNKKLDGVVDASLEE